MTTTADPSAVPATAAGTVSATAVPAAVPAPRLPGRLHHLLAVVLIAFPAGGALIAHERHVSAALTVGAVALAAILGLFEIAASRGQAVPERKAYGFAQVVLGADGRFSTSKSVVALWTVILATALVTVSALAWFTPDLTPTNVFGDDWNSLLLLLGGPFASAVIAKGVVSAKVGRDEGAKSLTGAASESATGTGALVATTPSVADLVSNDSGETDLVDSQYVVFTLVAMIYFVGAFASRLHDVVTWLAGSTEVVPVHLLPSIPDALLGLTSLAALTYVGNKAVTTQGLRTVSLKPNPVQAGEAITIALVNLPATATTSNVQVLLLDGQGTTTPTAPTSVGRQQLTVEAPGTAGSYSVVVAGDGYATAPQSVVVR